MSLLMDALKRAETSKQRTAPSPYEKPLPPSAGDMLVLEPLTADSSKGGTNSLPDLALHLETLDADLAQTPPTTSPLPPPAKAAVTEKPTDSREAVRNAFASKQTEQPPSRSALWLVLGTLSIAGVAIGGYVWYQMNALNQGVLTTSTPRPPTQPTTTAAPPAAQPTPAIPLAQNSDFGQNSRLTVEPSSQAAAVPLFPRQAARPAPSAAAEGDALAAPPIRLTRTRPEPDNTALRGYASLQRGEMELSRREFEQALRRDPNNTDVLLALAAIAHRQGRTADAEHLRQRALVANPSDPSVQAANLNHAMVDAEPNGAESRLKTLLSSQPESPALNFALGNLYSRQSRWAEAQQAYFNAVAADGDNPDYLFNLAVSLDHLRQPRLAAQHYRLALEAAAKRPAAFDHDKTTKRLGELQVERQP